MVDDLRDQAFMFWWEGKHDWTFTGSGFYETRFKQAFDSGYDAAMQEMAEDDKAHAARERMWKMDDLVKRLRAINQNYELARGVHCDISEAAARIEALEARIAKAERALHYIGYKSRPIDFTAEQLRLHARMALAAYREGSDT